MFDIKSQAWYSLSMLVLNDKVGIVSEFSR